MGHALTIHFYRHLLQKSEDEHAFIAKYIVDAERMQSSLGATCIAKHYVQRLLRG